MTGTEIREALAEVSHAVDVPVVDQVAFQARVRTERRRRTAGRALVGAAAAAAVVAAGVTATSVLREPESTRVSGPGPVEPAVAETVFFVLDGRLTALDPRGVVRDAGQRGEGVVGWTDNRVYAVDGESHVTVRRAEPPFVEVPSPVPGPVQSAALSGDGRYLAWLDIDGVVHRYDLDAKAEDLSFSVTPDAYVAGVAADGVLVFEGGRLSLRDGEASIPVPVQADGFSYASDVAEHLVVVNDGDGQSLLYDVSDGRARLLETFSGVAVLGPRAERVAVIVPEPADRARVEVWDGGTMLGVTGLDDVVPTAARWADETTLLVAGHDRLYACDIDLRCERLPVEGAVGLGE
jgi:hypothetical protein